MVEGWFWTRFEFWGGFRIASVEGTLRNGSRLRRKFEDGFGIGFVGSGSGLSFGGWLWLKVLESGRASLRGCSAPLVLRQSGEYLRLAKVLLTPTELSFGAGL